MICLGGRDSRWAMLGSGYSDYTGGISAVTWWPGGWGWEAQINAQQKEQQPWIFSPSTQIYTPGSGEAPRSHPEGAWAILTWNAASRPKEPQPRDTVYSKHTQESTFPTNHVSSEDPQRQAAQWATCSPSLISSTAVFLGVGGLGRCMSRQLAGEVCSQHWTPNSDSWPFPFSDWSPFPEKLPWPLLLPHSSTYPLCIPTALCTSRLFYSFILDLVLKTAENRRCCLQEWMPDYDAEWF